MRQALKLARINGLQHPAMTIYAWNFHKYTQRTSLLENKGLIMDIVFLAYHSWLFFKTIVQFSSPFPIIRFCFIRYCVQVWLNETLWKISRFSIVLENKLHNFMSTFEIFVYLRVESRCNFSRLRNWWKKILYPPQRYTQGMIIVDKCWRKERTRERNNTDTPESDMNRNFREKMIAGKKRSLPRVIYPIDYLRVIVSLTKGWTDNVCARKIFEFRPSI